MNMSFKNYLFEAYSLSQGEAIHELLETSNVISKIQTVQSVSNTEIFDA